jgi:hypothetical protein
MIFGGRGVIAETMTAAVAVSAPGQIQEYGQNAQPQQYTDRDILVLFDCALSMLKPMVLHIVSLTIGETN